MTKKTMLSALQQAGIPVLHVTPATRGVDSDILIRGSIECPELSVQIGRGRATLNRYKYEAGRLISVTYLTDEHGTIQPIIDAIREEEGR